jgi:hypothetical protein
MGTKSLQEIMALKELDQLNLASFNDLDFINKSSTAGLKKLASMAINAEQLNQVALAPNIDAEVVTAIINNPKVELYKLNKESFMKLIKTTNSSKELYELAKIMYLLPDTTNNLEKR